MRGPLLAAAVAGLLAVGCEEQGPAEEMGESLDETGESIQDSAEDAGNAVEDACEEAREGVDAEDTDC